MQTGLVSVWVSAVRFGVIPLCQSDVKPWKPLPSKQVSAPFESGALAGGIMRRVIIESPLMGGLRIAIRYAQHAMRDSLDRNEAPWASHLLYPQCLADSDPVQRKLGIDAGLLWGRAAGATIVYYDLGVSKGMVQGIDEAKALGREIEWRSLGKAWDEYRTAKTTLWLLPQPSTQKRT
jgi:hypothetical protein